MFDNTLNVALRIIGCNSGAGGLCLSQTYWLAVDRESGDADL
ncbi:MAG TPA: hypothetical protein VF957_17730 [Bradyrhizobium sp.]